jgi:hypothetical protein
MNSELIPAGESTAVAIRSGSPFDGNVAEFRGALARRGENRGALIDWVRSALVDGVDYGAIKRSNGSMTKPSLRKPGAEKICGMLGVIPTFPTLKDYEQLALQGIPIDQIILRCDILSAAGDVVANGVGARSLKQDNGDLNKALKMAVKSAHIDATLRMAGLSEIFTQDLEDMPPQSFDNQPAKRAAPQRQRAAPAQQKPATQAPRSTAPAGGRGFATEKQVMLIERRLDDAGIESRELCEHFEIDSLAQMPFSRVNEALDWVANGVS